MKELDVVNLIEYVAGLSYGTEDNMLLQYYESKIEENYGNEK